MGWERAGPGDARELTHTRTNKQPDAMASLAPAELGGKRPPPEDDLFDMGAPPEKRLTFDML